MKKNIIMNKKTLTWLAIPFISLSLLTGCSNERVVPDNSDLPSTEIVDPSLETLNNLVKNKETTIETGETIKLNVPLEEYQTLQVEISNPEVLSYTQGNIITETNPMPSSPPVILALSTGESDVKVTNSSGETFSFKIIVK